MEPNWRIFLLEHPINYFEQKIIEDINEFNNAAIQLHLTQTNAIVLNENEFKKEAIHDLGILQQLIENLNSDEYSNKINEIVQIREQYAKDTGIDIEPKKPQTLEMSVITESLISLEKWEIDYDDLELKEVIGAGGFAEVYLGTRKSTGETVAIKKLHQQKFDKSMLEMFKSEVAILGKLKHFAILPFVGACTKPPFCIVTKFMSGGSLFSRLHAKDESDKLSPTQLTIIALGIAFGMNYLHSQQMLHRDLKSLNILLDENNYPKISDFGMARTKGTGNEDKSSGIGTSQWMAPEVLNSNTYDEKADVYSYGMIIWEMLTGDVPYRGIRDFQVTMSVVNQKNRPTIPKKCPQLLAQFIRNCWNSDPKKRPTFKEIIREFKNRTIFFPGTDFDKVQEYVQKFASNVYNPINDNVSNEEKNLKITKEQIDTLINEFKNDENVITKIKSYNDDIILMFPQYDIVNIIVEHLQKIKNPKLISLHLEVLLKFLQDETVQAAFHDHNQFQVLADLLLREDSLNYPILLDCLKISIFGSKFKFTKQHLLMISTFLDVNTEKDPQKKQEICSKAIELLEKIIENKDEHCDDESIFTSIVNNLLNKATINTNTQILIPILNLLISISYFEGSKAQLRSIDAPNRICSLLKSDDNKVLYTALSLLQILFKGSLQKQHTISLFLLNFGSVINVNQSKVQISALNTLTSLMENYHENQTDDTFYREVTLCNSFANNFINSINSNEKEVQLLSLKICFEFCSNQVTCEQFLILIPYFFNLLQSSSYAAIMSAYCISVLLSVNDPIEILGEHKEELHNFLNNALPLESDLTEPGVRLVGVLTSTLKGALLINSWDNVMSNIAKLLDSKNDELALFAMMTMTSMSAACPESNVMYESIPLIVDACENYSLRFYPFWCLSNLIVVPRNAIKMAPYMSKMFEYLKYEQLESTVAIIIQRIVMEPEAALLLEDVNLFNEFIEAVDNLWKGQSASILFDIIEILTNYKGVCELMRNSVILEKVNNTLELCDLDDVNRPKYIRIRARLMKI
ncbi:TKL family protein kinase [Histomonas meleagridis]|uniref:TKL family protein kinase n=1 Tax=Histomonas meleagridis TaxID=135588 RepID=UPI003559AAE3|nr:TKL family protein kinase [Histomonas meleagridis]KAH0803554.1 TKL family protein kinase [Histomonas meleagridis]